MNIQKILDEFDKKFEHKKIQFRIHTGGFVNSDYELVEAKETIRAFLKQSLEQAYKQGVNDSIEKGKEMGWNAGEIVQDLEDKKAKLLKE